MDSRGLSLPNKNDASPVNRFPDTSRVVRLTRPNDLGIGPDNRLLTTWKKRSVLKSPKLSGIEPVSLLKLRSRLLIFGRREREGGIEPVSLFEARSSDSRLLSWERKPGTGPVRPVEVRTRVWRFVSRDMAGGMGPVRLGSENIWRVVRKGRFPTAGGIFPTRSSSPAMERKVTRPGWESSEQVMASQLQQSVFGSQLEKDLVVCLKWVLI